MESNLSNAFLLLLVGMSTVFLVLWIVVICGSTLIRLINRYTKVKPQETSLIKPLISNKEVAILTAVVEHITSGKGKIDSIEKLK